MKSRFLIGVLLLWLLPTTTQADEHLNFVFFLADDISHDDLGCYGHPSIKTPNIDRLAQSGMRFDNAYLTTSSCSPSRCSIITGRYPHNTGAPELHTKLPDGQVLFPEILKNTGYYTALSGKHHMGEYANNGFNLVSRGKGPGKEGDWVEILQNRPKHKPFFFWFASTDAHRGWNRSKEAPGYMDAEMIIPPYLIDDARTRKDLAGYAHEVSRFDHYVGSVVTELKSQGVLDNTMIIVAADNGRPFPRCKTRLYDSGIKTPFIVHCPNHVSNGSTKSLISTIDISATLLELAGANKDQRIQGLSFVPILKDPMAKIREVVFAEHNWHVFKNHERMVRFGDWLYIRNNFPGQQNLCMESKMGGAGKALWAAMATDQLTAPQRNIFWNPCPEEELYRVSKDPHQITNIAELQENSAQIVQARSLLADWTRQTGDSIPTNPTPDRETRPGQPKRKENHRHLEFPGEPTGATQINSTGPVKL